jgi:hypothetical protein
LADGLADGLAGRFPSFLRVLFTGRGFVSFGGTMNTDMGNGWSSTTGIVFPMSFSISFTYSFSSISLKEMAHKLGLSYPTVRNRLDDIISQLNKFESDEQDS